MMVEADIVRLLRQRAEDDDVSNADAILFERAGAHIEELRQTVDRLGPTIFGQLRRELDLRTRMTCRCPAPDPRVRRS